MYKPNESETITYKRILKKIKEVYKNTNKILYYYPSENGQRIIRYDIKDEYNTLIEFKKNLNTNEDLYIFVFMGNHSYMNASVVSKSVKNQIKIIKSEIFLKVFIELIKDINSENGKHLENITTFTECYIEMINYGYLKVCYKEKFGTIFKLTDKTPKTLLRNIIELKIIKEV